jgi:cell filamentation protein
VRQHPYCYPGTDVYRNKLDIRDSETLDNYERLITAIQMECLPRDIAITPSGFRVIHHHLLHPIYDWAGEDRYVDTGRPGAPFCKADYIGAQLDQRFAAINAEDNLRGLDADRFAARAAEHINELNAIHPFLDGNGRTLRGFVENLATQAGHEIDIARINP